MMRHQPLCETSNLILKYFPGSVRQATEADTALICTYEDLRPSRDKESLQHDIRKQSGPGAGRH
jgi:hypothetical protein